MDSFADDMMAKENEITFLKCNFLALRKGFENIGNEINLIKDENVKLRKELEKKIESLATQDQMLEKKVDLLQNQLRGSATCENKEKEIIRMKSEVEEVSNHVQFDKAVKLSSVIDGEFKDVKEEVLKVSNEILTIKDHLHLSLNEKTIEINELCAKVTKSEKAMDGKIKRGTVSKKLLKVFQKDVDEAKKNILRLENHVTNIENIIFSNTSDGSKDIILEWRLQNYKYHFDLGEVVCSPIFYTEIKGYCFKLVVTWSGVEKENLGLGLKLCRGSNHNIVLEPFNVQYSLEVLDNKGNISSEIVTLALIEANRERYFAIPPGEKECKEGFGYPDFLTMPDVKNFIVNDMLSVRCTLNPS